MGRRETVRGTFVLVLGFGLASAALAVASTPPLPPACSTPEFHDGAQTLVCVPESWNGNLVVFAHGYVAPTPGLPAIPWDQLQFADGTSLPGIVTGLGFAFATTSYSDDGLAIVPGVQDVENLVRTFRDAYPATDHVYLTGASEGGLVTALAVEQSPDVFSGGLATCGPVGDFRRQIDYLGDFRVLFDYFFPHLVSGNAIAPPRGVTQDEWDREYVPRITAAFAASPARLDTLLRVARAPFDPNEPGTKIETALGVLWYNVFATRDTQDKLDGNPYDNSRRLYLGSGDDFRLNLLVDRFHADAGALAAIEHDYQTSGRLAAPLVTLHTTADPIVPYWHEPLYTLKALRSGLLHTNLPVFRYGHCSFRAEDALVGLGLLVSKVEGRGLVNPQRVLPTVSARRRYRSLALLNGLQR